MSILTDNDFIGEDLLTSVMCKHKKLEICIYNVVKYTMWKHYFCIYVFAP